MTNQKVKSRYWFLTILLMLGACSYLFNYFYELERTRKIEEIVGHQKIHAKQAARSFNELFAKWNSVLSSLSKERSVAVLDTAGKYELQRLAVLLQDEIRGVTRTDNAGKIIYTVPDYPQAIGVDISGQAHMKKIHEDYKPVVSEVFQTVQGFQAIVIHYPVFRDGKFDGTIAFVLNFGQIVKGILDDIRIGTSGRAWLLSKEGLELYCPVRGHVGKSVRETGQDCPDLVRLEDAMLSGKEGVAHYTCGAPHNGGGKTEFIAYYLPVTINNTFWALAVTTAENEITDSLTEFRTRLIVIFGLILLSGLFLSYFGIRGWIAFRESARREIAEHELLRSEELYRNILAASIDGYILLDLNGRIRDVNEAFCRRLKYDRASLLTMDMQEFVAQEYHEKFATHIATITSRGSDRLVAKLKTRDGKLMDVEMSAFYLPGEEGGIVAFSHDITERRRTELNLQESERRFHELFDDAPVGYHELDNQGRIVEVNHTELHMLGYVGEEMVGHPVWEFIVERDISRKAILAKIAGNISTDLTYERTFRRKDGTTLKVLLKDLALRNEAGVIVGLRSAVQDITDRKQAEQELRLMAQTFASVRDCISITDLEDKILYVNDAFCTTYGYSREELLGKEVAALRSPHGSAATNGSILRETLRGGWHGEIVNRRKDGTDLPVELWTSVVRDATGSSVALVGVARNIAERQLVEKRLKQSEEQFRLIAENVADMIAVLDLKGRRIYTSPSYQNILGKDPKAVEGMDSFEEIHPDDREKVQRVFAETVRTGLGQRVEYRCVHNDGSVREIDAKASVIRDADGRIARVIVVSRDVTEEKKLDAQFLRAQRMESIGTLASGVAHDLNNVLAPILLAIEVLQNKMTDPAGQQILKTIESSAKRGSDIIGQVLAFARGVQGDRIFVQLRHIISEVVKIATETFPKSIEIREDVSRDVWTVSADPTQMHQVLLNMLVNARDAMPTGGTLTISAHNVTLDEKYSRLHLDAKPGEYVSIVIADTGIGIPAEIREKIFEPFFTTKDIGLGTGLGLSTTLAIIKSHGGFITLSSEMGRGTTFSVHLPATRLAPQAATGDEEAAIPMGHGETILIIDDEAAIREINRETLEAYGYKVLTTCDGAEGVSAFAAHRKEIKVVITDMIMPVMDGAAVIIALQQLDPAVKIIVASGMIPKVQTTLPTDSRVETFLSKPYTAEKLLRAVAAMFH